MQEGYVHPDLDKRPGCEGLLQKEAFSLSLPVGLLDPLQHPTPKPTDELVR